MLILADTNILLRLVEENHVQHTMAFEAIQTLRQGGHSLVIVPQVVYEFWAVATRPVNANGLGMTVQQAQRELDDILPLLRILRDERGIYQRWQQLVLEEEVTGKQVHDARLVAAMRRHDVSHLLTFNVAHFARYSKITVVEPHLTAALPAAE